MVYLTYLCDALRKITLYLIALSTCHSILFAQEIVVEKEIVVIVPSYNNEEWYLKNLDSLFSQKYSNFKVIYINDNSSDNTLSQVVLYIKERHLENKMVVVNNDVRQGALYNIYHAVQECPDQSIILIVDGDDWLKHDKVFCSINQAYSDSNIWLTYGTYDHFPERKKGGCCAQIPADVVKKNNFRGYKWVSSAPRSFYAWLFKKIKKEDLLHEGKFFEMAWDLAFMFPMLEMSGERFKYISEILYTYNVSNPINDSRKNGKLQGKLDSIIRKKERYQRLQ